MQVKRKRYKSKKYLGWVKTQPCVVCGSTGGVAAHHVTGILNASGMGMKPDDTLTMPACDIACGSFNNCHHEIHASSHLRSMQPDWLLQIIGYGLNEFPSGDIHDALIEARAFIQSKQEVGA